MPHTVLVVEDDAAFAYAIWRHLRKFGLRVRTVSGSTAALQILESTKIDLVITDIRLLKDEAQGLSLARTIKQRTPDTPVILVTAYPELLKGEDPLPGPVFEKPVELSTLRNAVTNSLAA